MKPRIKFGLIVGIIGLVINIFVAFLFGFCGPLTALVAGVVAGFLTAQGENTSQKTNGAGLGAVAGIIAGALVLIGQLIASLASLGLFQFTGLNLPFGGAPAPSADVNLQIVYYLTGLGTGACIGIVGIVLAGLGGAGAGYLGTKETPKV